MRLKHTTVVVASLMLALIILRPAPTETASPTVVQLAAQVDALAGRVTTLEGQISGLQTTVSTQASQMGSLQTAVGNLQIVNLDLLNRLQFVTVSGTEMYITGANLNIRNGLEATNGNPNDPASTTQSDFHTNGLGNLAVGYNEAGGPHTGSHNIIVGAYHRYTSTGGLVAGYGSDISGAYVSISGGFENRASGTFTAVSGGFNNFASGNSTAVSGGFLNRAGASFTVVSGGENNRASSDGATVSGGNSNTASGNSATVSGGISNTATGTFATVSGGSGVTENVGTGWSAGGTFHNP